MIAPRLLIRAADLFCGAGGSSTGMLAACNELGYSLDLTAVNHWPVAVETHTANHGSATHFCEDLGAIDPRKAVPGGHLHLLVASPECTHHSNARGGKPMQDQSRASAWHVLRWAQALVVDNILVENVPEFQHWGGLGENGRPLKSKRGATFRAWLQALRSQGYRVEHRVLNAADYGDATTRKRLFIVARRGNRRIHWPEPSHAPQAETDLLGSRLRWRAAREIIDWSIPGKSIFARKKPLSPNTMRRIVAGLRRFGGPELEPFIVMLNGTQPEQTDRSSRGVDAPLPTVTAAPHLYLAEPFLIGQQTDAMPRPVSEPAPTVATAGAIALVQPFLLPNEGYYRGNQARSVDEPIPTVTANHGAGGIVQPFIVPQFASQEARGVDRPLGTITTQSRGVGLAQAFILSAGGPNCEARSTEEPMGTVLTRDHRALVQPFLVQTDQTGAEGPGVRSTEEPMATVVTKQNVGLVQSFIVGAGGPTGSGEPQTTDKPLGTVIGKDSRALVEPYIVEFRGNHAGKNDGDGRVKSLDAPLPTQTCDNRFGLARPFVVPVTHAGGEERVHDTESPLPTVTGARRGELALAEPYLTKFYGTGTPASVEEPLDTVTAKDRFGLVQPTIRTADGQTFALDIHFRMLQPHELAGAMSFPAGYVFTGNREAQVKQIGNAVPVKLSKALIRALLESEVAA